jgi:hypothetical protein
MQSVIEKGSPPSRSYGGPQSKCSPSKSQRPSDKAIPSLRVQLPDIHPTKVLRTNCLTGSCSRQWHYVLVWACQGLQPRQQPVTVSISPVTVLKVSFSNPSYTFVTQEWLNLARDDVLNLRRTPPLVAFCLVRIKILKYTAVTARGMW